MNTCRVISSHQDEQAEEIKLPDGHIADNEKAVVVLVIGESARKANFQLYGYQRDTNPLLSKQEELKVFLELQFVSQFLIKIKQHLKRLCLKV